MAYFRKYTVNVIASTAAETLFRSSEYVNGALWSVYYDVSTSPITAKTTWWVYSHSTKYPIFRHVGLTTDKIFHPFGAMHSSSGVQQLSTFGAAVNTVYADEPIIVKVGACSSINSNTLRLHFYIGG